MPGEFIASGGFQQAGPNLRCVPTKRPGPELRSRMVCRAWSVVPGRLLLRAFSGQHHADGFKQDHDVKKQGVVLDVIQVVLELFS